MDLAYIKSMVKEYSNEIKSRIIIVDTNNIVQADSGDTFVGEVFKHDEINSALKGMATSNIHNFKIMGRVMYVAVPVTVDKNVIGATLISASINSIYEEVQHIQNKIIIISIVSMLVNICISFLLMGLIFQPLDEFKRVINKASQGNLKEKINIETNDEFRDVADAFNMMILKLDQADTERKDFVANVSHELRTPLSSIKILSESLLSENEENIEIYREFLQDIDSEVDRLNNIISDLLSLTTLGKENIILNYRTTYINFLLEKIVLSMKPLAEKKSIKLTLILEEKVQISIDQDKIQQAVINVIDNAIKYTQQNGLIEIKLYTLEQYAVIAIKDNGIGIPEDCIPHIFERFYRVDKARSRETGGTGLGLSISWQIVSLHKGIIEVDSQYGKGSTFYIKLPLQ
ncbi:HAMP domain-containing sensor histidine kinase [Acidilutibacter cellobiosedens]|jgi:signal transduction histidine kinase|uniref:histidine kinase n=2 Tax=Acidilutibacter cellobiosedens TaxID=2507161 RepID=A0A410QHL1_9FIRM|nr:HAMP domain-containing sensor histidine kinase [Tissierellaceae bacterium]QAT63453.1 HAMP domain-containing sensor histidine kinase [Acidilutibacter cellobiosedens]